MALKINQARTVAVGSGPAPVVIPGIDTSAAAGAVRNLGSDFPNYEGEERPSPSRSVGHVSRASSVEPTGYQYWPKAGKRATHRLYGTGLVPALGYAAEVTGFSPAELAIVQSIGLTR